MNIVQSLRHHYFSTCKKYVLFQLLTIILAFSKPSFIEGAHSRRAPTTPRRISSTQSISKYDRSITMFNTDGRLLQVDYASKCSARVGQALAFSIHDGIAIIAVERSNTGGVQRSNNVHRIDSHILLFNTGLAGDGQSLASNIRQNCQQHTLNFGEKSSVKNVATEMIGMNLNHAFTMMKGSRPFGVTSTIVGVDDCDVIGKTKSCRIFQCESGGVVQEFKFGGAGRFRDDVTNGLDNYEQQAAAISLEVTIERVAKSILDSLDNEESKNKPFTEEESHNEKGEAISLVDIYAVFPDNESRGGVCIQCAKAVDKNNLSLVSTLFTAK
eukprot:CAMPEP_0194371404 /NCGR_PEP_ID=MMETSP0174-20130528/19826_1 /TAXON_ID=216777 /ORGANISM="Proboscia alata, Strain PI-D3" /LENGTH=326 /DNA_ID=CAMNT_0039149457 /DNA_START=89 /DNA_END=1069 /DNA_ORIENTATION=+